MIYGIKLSINKFYFCMTLKSAIKLKIVQKFYIKINSLLICISYTFLSRLT